MATSVCLPGLWGPVIHADNPFAHVIAEAAGGLERATDRTLVPATEGARRIVL